MLETIQALDAAILLWIQDVLRLPILNKFFEFYTHLGDMGFLWVALSILMLVHPKTRKAGFLAIAAILVGVLFTNVVLKHLFERSRPYLVVQGLAPLASPDDPFSFPSGHATAAFAAASVWWRALPWRWMRVTGLLLAVLMAISRLYVGVHFPTDVLVGCLMGALSGALVWAVYRRLAKRGRRGAI